MNNECSSTDMFKGEGLPALAASGTLQTVVE